MFETHNPQPRVFISLYISPISARHEPAFDVCVKLISICQSARDASSGKSKVVNWGKLTNTALLVAYTVFRVEAPFATVATVPGLTVYVKSPKLFELGSINEKELSVILKTPVSTPSVIVEIRGWKERPPVLNAQLDEGTAILVNVPWNRLLVLSSTDVYVAQPVP